MRAVIWTIPLKEKRGKQGEDLDRAVSHIGHKEMAPSSQRHLVAYISVKTTNYKINLGERGEAISCDHLSALGINENVFLSPYLAL